MTYHDEIEKAVDDGTAVSPVVEGVEAQQPGWLVHFRLGVALDQMVRLSGSRENWSQQAQMDKLEMGKNLNLNS